MDRKLLLGLRRSVGRMVTVLPQLLVTVVDRKTCGWTGSIVVPIWDIKGASVLFVE
jgi:hypothetical protein